LPLLLLLLLCGLRGSAALGLPQGGVGVGGDLLAGCTACGIHYTCRSCKHLKQLGIDSTNQVSRHVLMEIKKTFPNLATKTRP
jgi:hypothetical protein